MRLDHYFFITKISKTEFAQRLGITLSHLSHISAGKRAPSRKLAKKICELTQGYVSVNELLFPEDYPPATLENFNKGLLAARASP